MSKKILVCGTARWGMPNSPYYRKELPDQVKDILYKYMHDGCEFFIIDRPGVNRMVMEYLAEHDYSNVHVYTTNSDDFPFKNCFKEWPLFVLHEEDIDFQEDNDKGSVLMEGLAILCTDALFVTPDASNTCLAFAPWIKTCLERHKPMHIYKVSKFGPACDQLYEEAV